MACEVAVMNPQMDVSAMESLYNQGAWSQPLSPELSLSSPVYAQSPQGSVHSPCSVIANSPVLSHAGSPMPGCCSPVSVHSPNMQAAHSPPMVHSPVNNMLSSVKQEQLDVELCYAASDSHDSLSSLLRNNEMIAAQNMAMAPPHMGPPHPREILDGKCEIAVKCVVN